MEHLKDRDIIMNIRKILAIPFIWGMLASLIFLHLSAEIYHQVAFRLYGLKLVDWKKYIKIDRHKLSKLTFLQKIYCVYCGYTNGLLPYAVAIAAETEKYWCGIKHSLNENHQYIEPNHHGKFAEYEEYK